MDKTQQMMKNKKRRFAILSAVMAVLVVAVAVFGVKLAYEIPWRYDMTAQRIFTLSGQTEAVLDELDQTVRVAAVYSKGKEEMMVQSLLDEYAKASDNIAVEYIDAEREPAKLAAYQLDVAAIPNGTIIVRSATQSKLIANSTLFETTSEGNVFNGEREITGAIRYVTATEMPKIYLLQGHDEVSTNTISSAISALQLAAYQVDALNLRQQGAVPDDADVLLMVSPTADITAEEKTMLEDYMRRGGGFLLSVDPITTTDAIQLPNLNALCNSLGVDITNNYVVEEDSDHYLTNYPTYLIPDMGAHEITAPIGEAKRMIVLPVARGLGTVEYDTTAVTLAPLLASSDKSWIRVDMSQQSATRTETDLNGPIILGYAASVSNVKWGNDAARVVVLGNGTFAYDSNIEVLQGNQDLWINCVNWIEGGRQTEIIASKVINADRLVIRGTDFVKLTIICVAVLPLIAFAAAFLVWMLRRNQ